MKPLTVARSLYGRLKKEGGKINKAVILRWEIPYEEKGQRKTANADTVGRTLRDLVTDGWLAQEEKNGQAYYWVLDKNMKELNKEADEEYEKIVDAVRIFNPKTRSMRTVSKSEVGDYLSKGYERI